MHIGSSVKPTSSGVADYGSFDGLLADVYFTDGYAKSPTDFIESNDYGGYKPKAYTGSFGTNGFHIDAQPAHDADLLVTSVARNDGDTTFADVAAGHTITLLATQNIASRLAIRFLEMEGRFTLTVRMITSICPTPPILL